MNKQPTKEAIMLHEELKNHGVSSVLEHWDGHKHVDLFVQKGNFYIEIDGPKHYTDAKQIMTDFIRDHYSDIEGYPTLRISNKNVVENIDDIVKAISDIVMIRQ